MLLYVKLSDFRGVSCLIDLADPSTGDASPRVALRGQNGSKKTTVREAVSFLFTGRDSLGTVKPTHLISLDKDSCEVEVKTRKGAVLTRSLTRKGGGSLRMIVAGEKQTLSQSDFENMLCPADVFLSVFVPGYLLGHLPKNRQSAVLSFMLPPVDRKGYMEKCLEGAPVMDLDYSKRPDLLQKQLADHRNEIAHKISELRGEHRSLTQRLGSRPEKPIEPKECVLLSMQEHLQREWARYERDLETHEKKLSEYRQKRVENEKIQQARSEAESELRGLRETPFLPPPEPFMQERPLHPMQPALHHEETRDRCPSCGQTVGSKHLETVRALNAAITEEYQAAYIAFKAELKDWEAARDAHGAVQHAYEKEVSAIQKVNAKVASRRHHLEWQLSSVLRPHDLPELLPEPPKKPAEEFSRERYLEMSTIVENYLKALGAYDRWHSFSSGASIELESIERMIQAKEADVEWYRRHEGALRLLPGYELTEQKTHLAMPSGYELWVEEGLQLFDRTGCPYDLLSRGLRMHADFQICLKVNALLQRKVGMVFLDDFDLADWGELLKDASPTVQIFSAHVAAGHELEVRLSK